MHHIFTSLPFLLLWPCLSCQPNNTSVLPDSIIASESPGGGHGRPDGVFPTKDYSWARGNQSCPQLLKKSLQYLRILPSLSVQLVGPALGLGLVQVGCLAEIESYHLDLFMDEDTKEMLKLLSSQWRTHIRPSGPSRNRNNLDMEVLGFNLDSLSPLSSRPHHCSGFGQEKAGVWLKGSDFSVHRSLQEAQVHCSKLGPSCAGVALDNSGEYHTVARNGGYILPKKERMLWLQRCSGAHVRRRAAASQCNNEMEQGIYSVMQWVPMVSGLYNAGTAIYYATQDCGEQAKERAIEASLDLGYDALLAVTGGSAGAVGLGLGLVLKPGLKAGVRKAIEYFKEVPQHGQTAQSER
ncbi:apolipoprotein F [Ascaphus truei]|uniref:apolipoprotein F n=1 Tax=Ascaphus truei TaxID=8439 RepID=UPI003F593A82